MGAIMNTDELIDDEDLDTQLAQKPGIKQEKTQAAELLAGMEGLSARERNKLKRKAKVLGLAAMKHAHTTLTTCALHTLGHSLQGCMLKAPLMFGRMQALSRTASLRPSDPVARRTSLVSQKGANAPRAGTPDDSGAPGQSSLLARATSGAAEEQAAVQAEAEADEAEWSAVLAGAWPFQSLCDQLCVDVLDPNWEVRHGAAVALRELLRVQAGAAGVEAPMADEVSGWVMAGGSGECGV